MQYAGGDGGLFGAVQTFQVYRPVPAAKPAGDAAGAPSALQDTLDLLSGGGGGSAPLIGQLRPGGGLAGQHGIGMAAPGGGAEGADVEHGHAHDDDDNGRDASMQGVQLLGARTGAGAGGAACGVDMDMDMDMADATHAGAVEDAAHAVCMVQQPAGGHMAAIAEEEQEPLQDESDDDDARGYKQAEEHPSGGWHTIRCALRCALRRAQYASGSAKRRAGRAHLRG